MRAVSPELVKQPSIFSVSLTSVIIVAKFYATGGRSYDDTRLTNRCWSRSRGFFDGRRIGKIVFIDSRCIGKIVIEKRLVWNLRIWELLLRSTLQNCGIRIFT